MNAIQPIRRVEDIEPVQQNTPESKLGSKSDTGPEGKAEEIRRPAPVRKRRRWPWLVLVLLAAGGALAAYAYRDALWPQAAAPAAPAAPAELIMRLSPLEIATVAPVTLRETVKVSGSLAPVRQTTVTSQIAGRIEAIDIQPGQAVTGGEVIARLDTADVETRIAQQEAAIAATQAQLDFAERQLLSTQSLAEKGLASPSALENAQSNVNGLRANIAAQQAQLAGIRLSLDYAVIRAPFDGVVSVRNVEPGQTVGAGSAVASVVDLTSMEARMLAPLSAAGALAVGQSAELTVEGLPGRVLEADISRINPVALEGTRSIQIYLALDPTDAVLRGGMFVTGTVVLEEKAGAVTAPAGALRKDHEGDFVLTVADGRLVRTPVTPGRAWNNGRVVEIESGLDLGQAFVSAPLPELQPGMAVKVEG